MFIGGTETTSSAAEWIITELMRNPDVMAKAQAEVRRVFDKVSPQDHEAKIDELHYTKMVIKESMRLDLGKRRVGSGSGRVKVGSRVA